ncbi:hypothetical protein [Streptosporangium sp. V21-05]|uniref:hypothetical protein n=1 Tax=Streptosporangium sp. V21-05 TaxID=3446115 RepID=UPI003F5357FA
MATSSMSPLESQTSTPPSFFAAATSVSRSRFASSEGAGSGCRAVVAGEGAPVAVEGAQAAAASASSATGMIFLVRHTVASLLPPIGVAGAAKHPDSAPRWGQQ